MKLDNTHKNFAVKRGKVMTMFVHAECAYTYWRKTLGGIFLEWSDSGRRWVPIA